jgi:hypothetical protein
LQYAFDQHVTIADLSDLERQSCLSDLRRCFFDRERCAKRVVEVFLQYRALSRCHSFDNVTRGLLRCIRITAIDGSPAMIARVRALL